jgi:hypothetical protein
MRLSLRTKKVEPIVYYGRTNDIWPARQITEGLYCWFCALCGLGCRTEVEAEAEGMARRHAPTHPDVTVQREEPRR